MKVVAAVDFLSHQCMHLPFNEGYVRVLRAGFPDARVLLLADKDHLANLPLRLRAYSGIEFLPIKRFSVGPSQTPHNPIWGQPAAQACWRQLEDALADCDVEFAALLGAEANLLRVFRRNWVRRFGAPLHFILHNHLAAALTWRTRNPLYRLFDFMSELRKGFPPNQKLVVLELGIAGAVEELLPTLKGSVVTLEHPVLEQEWSSVDNRGRKGPIRVGFLGHCSRGKRFDMFVDFARRFTGPALEFHAIGLASKNDADLDGSVLKRAPSPESLPRDIYTAAIADMDLICLPLDGGYNYVASGSVIDAIAATKPIALIRNESYAAMAEAYGPFGPIATDAAELESYFATFSFDAFRRKRPLWATTLRRIRDVRRPAALALGYPPERQHVTSFASVDRSGCSKGSGSYTS